MSRHAYGWKPSVADVRDLAADVEGLTSQAEVDPRPDMPPVYNQGQLGSCTACAVGAAWQYDTALNIDHMPPNPSRLFIYYGEREREGTITSDAGAFGRDGFKVLRADGVCPEMEWPYDLGQFAVKPSQEAYQEAAGNSIEAFVHPGLGKHSALLDRVEAFKRLLSNRQTIAFGFTVYESFEEEEKWDQGVMPLPYHGEAVLGGHEVLLVGYLSEYPDCGLCRNSWGPDWQLGGYFLMPWKYLASDTFSSDWRSIYRRAGK